MTNIASLIRLIEAFASVRERSPHTVGRWVDGDGMLYARLTRGHDITTRRVLQPDNTHTEEQVMSASMALWRRLKGDEPPPDYFVDAGTITPEDHVRMQAAAQAHIDSAVSKTVNLPKDISFDDFKDVYRLAYESGCKGCTTYRPNDITGAVLVADGDTDDRPASTIMDRPAVLDGQTRKVSWPGSEHAFYLVLNHSEDADGTKRPFEIFINTTDARHHAWITAVTRVISAVWRRQGDVGFVAEELMAISTRTIPCHQSRPGPCPAPNVRPASSARNATSPE